MRLPSKIVLALAVAAPVTYSTAFAQSVGVEVYGGPGYYYADPDDDTIVTERRAPRVYGYRSSTDTPDVEVQLRPSNCGQYRYWNGVRCADARVNPPDID